MTVLLVVLRLLNMKENKLKLLLDRLSKAGLMLNRTKNGFHKELIIFLVHSICPSDIKIQTRSMHLHI